MNIVVFGVTEDRKSTVWREQVLDALQHVAGRTIDTDDMLRVGRFVAGKTRPVVVRLRSIWDRRLIVSSSYKLKNYNEHVFIRPDETLETRRKKMLERIKVRAETDGKRVLVVDGVLSEDGVDVFSLKDGNIRDQNVWGVKIVCGIVTYFDRILQLPSI